MFSLIWLSVLPVQAEELSDAVSRVMEQARKDGATMVVPVNQYREEGMKAAVEAAATYHSPTYYEKLRCEQKRIKTELFIDDLNEPEEEGAVPGGVSRDEKIYLFLSSSMPDETVQNYLGAVAQADEPNLAVVMRGFVPGEKGKYLARITKKDFGCTDQLKIGELCERYEVPITLRPSLFKKYEVHQVPTLVYEAGEQAWKISGDASLGFMLERINREAVSPALGQLAQLLR